MRDVAPSAVPGRAPRHPAATGRRTMAWLLAALLVVAPVTAADDVAAQERPSHEIERELDDTSSRAGELQLDLGAVRSDISEGEEELAAIGARLADARGRLQLADGQVALGERALADAQDEVEAAGEARARAGELLEKAEIALAEEEELFTIQLVHAFKYGTVGAQRGAMVLEVIRRAEDPNAFAVGMKQLQIVVDEQDATVQRVFALRDQREQRAAAAAQAQVRATEAAEAAEEALAMLERLREEAAEVAAEVEDEEAAQERALASLRASEGETAAMLSRVAARQGELEQELADQRAREEARRRAAEEEARRRAAEEEARREAERREQEAQREQQAAPEESSDGAGNGSGGGGNGNGGGSSGGGSGGSPPSGSEGAGGGPPIDGLVCPVVGAVAGRDFSNDWGYPRSGGRTHQGNDIFAASGTPVVAVADGVVIRWNPPSAPTGLGGITVTYRTADGSEWYKAHLDSVAEGIGPGVSVSRGQEIGTVGNTGNAAGTPPHLHIGRRHGGGWVNPWPTISPVCR